MKEPWAALAEPFDQSVVRHRPGPGGRRLAYVDARVVAQRLDDVLTPESWDFQVSALPGNVAHGRLVIFAGDRAITREDFGYPNSDSDEEPLKSAASDALKRCAVQLGVGRHLYGDNGTPGQEAAPRPVVAQRAPQAPTDDAEWSCPDHGTARVREGKRGGWYCAMKLDDGSWCPRKPGDDKGVEARPRPESPPLPTPPDGLPF